MIISITALITMKRHRFMTFCIMTHENDTHHNVTQHNDTQYNDYITETAHSIFAIHWIILFLLCYRLSVIMLSVIILNVSAPWGVTVAIEQKNYLKVWPWANTSLISPPYPSPTQRKLGSMQGILKGKYHCTIDLLSDWFGISCIATDNFCFLICKTDWSKPVKQEVNGTVILPSLVFPGWLVCFRERHSVIDNEDAKSFHQCILALVLKILKLNFPSNFLGLLHF
jgi:hypothetical protein